MAAQLLSLEDRAYSEWRERDLRNPVILNPDGSFPAQIRGGLRYRSFVAGFLGSHPRGVDLGELGIESKNRPMYWSLYGVGEIYREREKV